MAFKTDGSVHHSGIKNEVRIVQKLNNGAIKKIYPIFLQL